MQPWTARLLAASCLILTQTAGAQSSMSLTMSSKCLVDLLAVANERDKAKLEDRLDRFSADKCDDLLIAFFPSGVQAKDMEDARALQQLVWSANKERLKALKTVVTVIPSKRSVPNLFNSGGSLTHSIPIANPDWGTLGGGTGGSSAFLPRPGSASFYEVPGWNAERATGVGGIIDRQTKFSVEAIEVLKKSGVGVDLNGFVREAQRQ